MRLEFSAALFPGDLTFHPRMAGHPVDHLVQLPLDQLDLLLCAFPVEKPVPHVDRHTVHVLDLHEHLIRRSAERCVAALVGLGAVVSAREVFEVEPAREVDRFLYRAARDRTMVGEPFSGFGIGEEKPADILDAVVSDSDGYRARLAVHFDRG